MGCLIKFPSLWRFHILQTTKHCESLKYISTIVNASALKSKSVPQNKKVVKVFSPDLKEINPESLSNFTSISILMSNVSWAKISIPNLTVLEWNSCVLPPNFLNQMNEIEVFKLVNQIKEQVPTTDLYVLETQKKWKSTVNEMYLRSALIANLINRDKDLGIDSKLVIQNYELLNVLFDLIIGWERKSAKDIVEKIFKNSFGTTEHIADDTSYFKPPVEVSHAQCLFFFKSTRLKQECLAIVLLTAFAFMDIAVLKKVETRQKILKKLKAKF